MYVFKWTLSCRLEYTNSMVAQVLDKCVPSEAFPVTNRVITVVSWSQHCSAWMFSVMLRDTLRTSEHGIKIEFSIDGKLLNRRRLQGCHKCEGNCSQTFFRCDCAISAHDEPDMQAEINCFSTACNKFSLTVGTKKTQVVFQTASGNRYLEPEILVNCQTLQAIETFQHCLWKYEGESLKVTED